MKTGTCEQCHHDSNGERGCWRGPDAWEEAERHEAETGHVVWYDEDPARPTEREADDDEIEAAREKIAALRKLRGI